MEGEPARALEDISSFDERRPAIGRKAISFPAIYRVDIFYTRLIYFARWNFDAPTGSATPSGISDTYFLYAMRVGDPEVGHLGLPPIERRCGAEPLFKHDTSFGDP